MVIYFHQNQLSIRKIHSLSHHAHWFSCYAHGGFLLLNNKAPSHFYKDTLLFEHHTSGTDAFDTLHIGCEKFAQHVF